jgi:hypothetical protein
MDRESIWSVAWRAKNLYFVLFIIQYLAGVVLLAYREVFLSHDDSPVETLIAISQGSAPIAVASAANSLFIAESWRLLMVLAHSLEEYLAKRREERLAKATADGRADERQRWETWNELRKAAEAEGREPPPPPSLDESDAG